MVLLKRKIDKYLIEWKNSQEKKPLIVKGARQIGKTESIRNFAKNNYKSVIEINFVLQKKLILLLKIFPYEILILNLYQIIH